MAIPPFLPVENSTTSYWMTEPHALSDHRSSAELPPTVDTVIIGAGYVGASTAYYLTELGYTGSILMLEARDACIGATGRNGGHLKPQLYAPYKEYKAKYGQQDAERLLTFEAEHLAEFRRVIDKEGIACDFYVSQSCDCFFGSEDMARALASLDELQRDKVALREDIRIFRDDAAPAVSHVNGCKLCVQTPAGSLWPYKFVLGLLQACVDRGMNLQTNTPVTQAVKHGELWHVTTARGMVEARNVVFATNAYTKALLPRFSDHIIPIRGTACNIRPSPTYMQHKIPYSYGMRWLYSWYDYIIFRQAADGNIILGGAKQAFLHDSTKWYDSVDDSELIADGVADYFSTYMPKHFANWNSPDGGVDMVWTGILGYSSDALPHVGSLEEAGGFVCAGFHGHGMPRGLLCGKAIAGLVLGDESYLKQIPRPYLYSKARLDRAHNTIKADMQKPYTTVRRDE